MKKFFPNLVYLLLGLPLGVLYFVVLLTGFTLGAGLSITLIGIPILVAMIFVTYILGDLERSTTSKLLGIEIIKPEGKPARDDSALSILTAQLKSLTFWKEAVYLFLKMPLGIFTFVVSITFVSLSLTLLATPAIINFFPAENLMVFNEPINTMREAWLCFGGGLVLSAISILIVNGVANLHGKLTLWALGANNNV
jgi:hypothetical protein